MEANPPIKWVFVCHLHTTLTRTILKPTCSSLYFCELWNNYAMICNHHKVQNKRSKRLINRGEYYFLFPILFSMNSTWNLINPLILLSKVSWNNELAFGIPSCVCGSNNVKWNIFVFNVWLSMHKSKLYNTAVVDSFLKYCDIVFFRCYYSKRDDVSSQSTLSVLIVNRNNEQMLQMYFRFACWCDILRCNKLLYGTGPFWKYSRSLSRRILFVDVKQQLKIQGDHRSYVLEMFKGVPKVAPDDKEEIELLRISLKGTISVLED